MDGQRCWSQRQKEAGAPARGGGWGLAEAARGSHGEGEPGRHLLAGAGRGRVPCTETGWPVGRHPGVSLAPIFSLPQGFPLLGKDPMTAEQEREAVCRDREEDGSEGKPARASA